jgi:hypothetical protein
MTSYASPTAAPPLTPFAWLTVRVGAPRVTEAGEPARRFIPILGGEVVFLASDLADLSGRVAAGGGDWQDVGPDGCMQIDAHYILEVDGHGLVEVRSTGLRTGSPEVLEALARGELVDPSTYYFRTFVRMRTSAARLARLNGRLAIAMGARRLDAVELTVFEVG